jgi:hypothetical protein
MPRLDEKQATQRQQMILKAGTISFDGSGIDCLALLWHFKLSDICKEHVTVRTSSGWRSCEEVEDRLPDGRHAWLWRRS